MQSGSNKTCTIHYKDEEGVKSTPQNILERVFIIIALCTEVSSAPSIGISGSGPTTGTGLLGTSGRPVVPSREQGRPGGASLILGLEMSLLDNLEGQGGLFSGICQEVLFREGQRATLSSPKGCSPWYCYVQWSRWAATTPNRPWEICTEEAICVLLSQNTSPSPLELHCYIVRVIGKKDRKMGRLKAQGPLKIPVWRNAAEVSHNPTQPSGMEMKG